MMCLSRFRLTSAFSRLPHQSTLPLFRHLCTTPTSTPTTPFTPHTTQPPQTSPQPSSTPPPDELTILFDAILLQVPHHGWTPHAIDQAIRTLGWSPASRAMLPRGPVQVVEEFVRRCDTALARQFADTKHSAPEIPSVDRAEFAIRTRLEMIEPFHARWPAALKLRALPRNSRKALRDSALLADEIADYAGFTRPDVCCTRTQMVIAGL